MRGTGPGLVVKVLGVTIDDTGKARVDFALTDEDDVPLDSQGVFTEARPVASCLCSPISYERPAMGQAPPRIPPPTVRNAAGYLAASLKKLTLLAERFPARPDHLLWMSSSGPCYQRIEDADQEMERLP